MSPGSTARRRSTTTSRRRLRDHGVEVLYLRELLAETLEVAAAREELLDAALRPQAIGPTLAETLRDHLASLPRRGSSPRS